MRKKEYTERLIFILDLVGNKIKAGRQKKDWSQDQLAKKAKVSRGTIAAAENSQAISLDKLVEIADALEISLFELFFSEAEQIQYRERVLKEMLSKDSIIMRMMGIAVKQTLESSSEKEK